MLSEDEPLTLTQYIKLYGQFMKNGIIREMMFRWNFIIRITTELFWLAASLLFWQIMFISIHHIAGWSKYEVYLLVGTGHLIHQAFEGIFFNNIVQIPENIRTGNLDFYLTKPVHSQFLVSTRYIDLGAIANILVGFGIVGYSLWHLNASLTLFRIIAYLVLCVNGILLYYSILFTLMTISFWIVRADGVIGVYFNVINFSRQPADIYKGLFKFFLIFVFPMLVTLNFPVQALVKSLSLPYMAWALFVGTLSFWLSSKFWHFGIRHYSSASS